MSDAADEALDQRLHDHNRPVNVFQDDPKVGLKHACIVNATAAYTEPETGYPFNQPGDLDEGPQSSPSLFMQSCISDVVIDEVPNFLALIPSKNTHAIQQENPFDTILSIIIPLTLKQSH